MPAVLKELMRHEAIESTMQYYVGQNAEATADELWRLAESDVGNLFGNPEGDEPEGEKSSGDTTDCHQKV